MYYQTKAALLYMEPVGDPLKKGSPQPRIISFKYLDSGNCPHSDLKTNLWKAKCPQTSRK